MKSIIQGTFAGKWALPKALQVSLIDTRDYDDRLEKAVDQPILIYDWATRSAWLVSELSLILHLVLTFLKQPRVQKSRRYHDDHGFGPWPELPFAEESSDGGNAALAAIREHNNMYLYTKENGDKKLFWNIVDDYLKDFAKIQNAVKLRKAISGWQLFGHRLQG